jgi:hypothetical protein
LSEPGFAGLKHKGSSATIMLRTMLSVSPFGVGNAEYSPRSAVFSEGEDKFLNRSQTIARTRIQPIKELPESQGNEYHILINPDNPDNPWSILLN